ncbi:hypothetical protein K438DRAFT_1970283 [Mycena galopus ATCC 62051]|nr:hypothetical protein K438DRAFT_1970283 [Mycena galopus ATCC 62051]
MVSNLNAVTAVILLGLNFDFMREASAQTVTLYAISEGVVAETSWIHIGPSTTLTLFSVPTTYTETFVEDASGFAGSLVVFGPFTRSQIVAETCSFGADGRGACIETLSAPGASESGEILTESGSVVPVQTLTAVAPNPPSSTSQTQTPTSSTSQSSARTVWKHKFTVWNVLVVGMALFPAV